VAETFIFAEEVAIVSADLSDRTDFDTAMRGLVSRLEPGVVKAADGRVVYDADVYTRHRSTRRDELPLPAAASPVPG
jgi:alkyl sulfatase BDS1-like metallo-beta-lactamase superfamily hydrolase